MRELLLFNAISAIFQLYHGGNKLIINEIIRRSQNQQSTVEMSPHWDIFSWFRANQSLLSLLNAACLVEKQQIPIIVFSLIWSKIKPMINHTHNHYITDAVQFLRRVRKIRQPTCMTLLTNFLNLYQLTKIAFKFGSIWLWFPSFELSHKPDGPG